MNEKAKVDIAKSKQEMPLTFKDFEKIKFTFSGIEKYIIMELKTSTPLEDLKFRFSSILRTDFFAKRLEFHVVKGFKDKILSSQKSLQNQGITSDFKAQGQGLQKKERDFYFISSWKFIKYDFNSKRLRGLVKFALRQFYNEEHLQEIFQVLFDKTIQSYINIIDCFQTLLSNAAEKKYHGKIIQSKPYIILSILLEKILSLEEVLAFFEDCINNRLDIETELDTILYIQLYFQPAQSRIKFMNQDVNNEQCIQINNYDYSVHKQQVLVVYQNFGLIVLWSQKNKDRQIKKKMKLLLLLLKVFDIHLVSSQLFDHQIHIWLKIVFQNSNIIEYLVPCQQY